MFYRGLFAGTLNKNMISFYQFIVQQATFRFVRSYRGLLMSKPSFFRSIGTFLREMDRKRELFTQITASFWVNTILFSIFLTVYS